MNVIFFNDKRKNFLPLVYTKPLCKVRFGILTIEEKWKEYFTKKGIKVISSYHTEDYLDIKYPLIFEDENVFINSRYMPNERLVDFIVNNLIHDEAIFFNNELIATKCTKEQFLAQSYYIKDTNESFVSLSIDNVTDLFVKTAEAINNDYSLLTKDRISQQLSTTNTIIGKDVFVEEGAKIEAAVLNASNGPIYIGKNAEVMEGSLIRGPFALGEGGALKMGAKIYGPTSIGKHSKVGGEVNNSVIQDYSNKGHDGFLGNSVVGEWCNLGADTNTSNLKNNYSNVRLWSYTSEKLEQTELQFCGLIMGDHSKCGINTMFNTATTVGVSANVFDSGFPPKFIPSYSWGGSSGFETFNLTKMFEVAQAVMQRRGVELTTEDKAVLTAIFEQTAMMRE